MLLSVILCHQVTTSRESARIRDAAVAAASQHNPARWVLPVNPVRSPEGSTKKVDVCLRCMSATRTQIYLPSDMRERIDRVARMRGIPMAEVVREAVDRYLVDIPDVDDALERSFGADPTAASPSRDEWRRG